ncbi:replication initiation and membrane attachment family protein [Lederbergia sp. NSJ-179]|uniref:replication initiation and membrane attachment family protein n=1 Tax=Lederbergia sp. NSJ-179 TaxID=2931402 RepID=UPI0028BE32D6|nr:replication initiation and membrane attachment family protein [Lederbergia sp. NSJ-179]
MFVLKPYWNEIQPIDSFTVKMNGLLHQHDQKVIDSLYQPLIGPFSTALYYTLWNRVQENRIWSEELNHYHLMNFFDLNLEEIFQARLKLEGIGLLKTYVKTNGDTRSYLYELQPPLSPEGFFTDGILNIYLYQKIGKSQFLKLKQLFTDEKADKSEYKEWTRSFQDVFASLGSEALIDKEAHLASQPDENHELLNRQEPNLIKIGGDHFNFDLLYAGLSEIMVPRRVFTQEVKEAISKLAYLYSIDAVNMKNIVLASLDADQTIHIEDLRKEARNWYQLEHDNQLPQLVDRVQPVYARTITEPQTKEEKLIFYLESVSPRQFLIDLADGGEPALSDLQAVEDVLFSQKLSPGVINVLIHYVMLKTDMKLSKNYMAKIASHWSRKKIKTVKEAIDLAKSEHRQYQQWANERKTSTQKRNKPIRTEKLPDWFMEPQGAEEVVLDEKQEAKRRRLEAIQQKYRKEGGDRNGANQ